MAASFPFAVSRVSLDISRPLATFCSANAKRNNKTAASCHCHVHHALLSIDRRVAHRAARLGRRHDDVRVALHAHHQVVARHVQAAALVVHAHHAEVAIGIVIVVVDVAGGVGGVVVGELLLLDLDEALRWATSC